jgi:hypothetical protein
MVAGDMRRSDLRLASQRLAAAAASGAKAVA